MMTHPTLELTALLDGSLPEGERAELETHLAACSGCRAERDRLAATLALLSTLPPAPAPSPTFEARFQARLAAERAPRASSLSPLRGETEAPSWSSRALARLRAGFGWRTLAPGLAGVAAAAGVFLYVGLRHRTDEAFLAEHLELFENFEAVSNVATVETPEDLQVVAHLDELREGRP